MGDNSVGILYATRMKMGASYATSKLVAGYDIPPNVPMACDDTEGASNHGRTGGGGMNVVFFDTHVEYWPGTRVDPERGVGAGDLAHLRN